MEIDFRNYQTVSEAVKGQIRDMCGIWDRNRRNISGRIWKA